MPGGIAGAAESDVKETWPRWRGPEANGAQPEARPPVQWSESENVRWKVEVPGQGSSTPIVVGDRVFVSTAVKTDRVKEGASEAESTAEQDDQSQPAGDRPGRGGRGRFGRRGFGGGAPPTNFFAFMVVAFDRQSGKEVWRKTLTEEVPHEPGHNTNTFASSSPVYDGQRLYVSFGSRGVYALDLDGNVLWQKDLGKMQTRAQFGEGSSPAVHDGTVVVPWDHEGESFIVALGAADGQERWRQSRDEPTTWATPLITEFQGRTQVITNGDNRVRSYDLADGSLIWECGGQASNPIPSPIRYKDNVIVMTGYRGYAIYSIPLDSKGDLTDTDQVSWVETDAAPYVSSPLLYDGQLYFVKSNNGILVSRSAETGELLIDQTRLPGISSVYASPVAAGDHIYLTGRDGTTLVFKHGKTFELVATNRLDEEIDASAAIVGKQIFFRGKEHLYCIE
ncbi:PQQ-binding-like beta-propeller repeat protein [Roseiconus nitratireducens]|uniref:PQQ-binding-like beta-propeller repeat protein n=1 Tax=Roseiconus nitratireducens TaxID=2605748 RepID=A0A5M6D354_9BACT|nr:PQQ-binding-like beta-propeller repeat protein [Roseiconus nitratireducens]KAA5541947.1 PQQ-binding-like beta-propeller repeat protein [Roseiconus nitratireducens]